MTATQQDISNRCFSRQDIELFGILKHPVHVFDVQNQQMWWANHAALRDIWQAKTLEDLLTRDFTDTTAATTIRMQGILSRIEAGDICREQWTLYPNGKAQTVEIIISLIKIDDGRSAFLCEASDLDNKDFDESRTRGIEMFRHVSIALCEFSATGNPIYRNAEDLKMLGTCFEDRFVDKNLGKKLLQMIQIGKEIDTEAEQKRADGATRWYSVALRNGKDPVSGDRVIIYSGRDITDIVQARRDVSQAKMKSEFLNVIAHELRTPLHQVIGYSDILELTTLSEVQLDSVKLIQRSTESLMAIINDLLDFSAYEENGVKVSNIGFSLRGLLKGCLAAVQLGASMKQLTLNLDIRSSVPKVVIGDPHKLRQVLLSLLQNAIKFNRKGGTVSFRVCPTALLDQTHWLRFEIQDTGIGIDEKHQGLIFEKYQQVDMNNTRSFDGKGLGLAICKSVSEAMGGKIYLESKLGEGSSFFVELPFKRPVEQTHCASVQPFRLMALDEPLRVLVVDDNEVNKKMAQRMVERMGHTTMTAENGQVAINIIKENEIDLVLMDVQMPVMDGIQATKYIRRRLKRSKRNLPVIGLTASFQHADLKFYLNIGMNTCLGKPVRLDTLKRSVESVASRCASGLYSDDSESTFTEASADGSTSSSFLS